MVVPNSAEAPLPDRLEEFDAHLYALVADPNADPDAELFGDVGLQLTEGTSLALIPCLLPRLTHILSHSETDLTAVAALLERLTRPLTFAAVLALVPPATLTACLDSPSEAINELGRALVAKAAASPEAAAMLASHQHLVVALVRRWLSSPSVTVGNGLGRALAGALRADCRWASGPLHGEGALWLEVFGDMNTVAEIIVSCTRTVLAPQYSLAQDRLLRVLPLLAGLDLPLVSGGPLELLRKAALELVDRTDDVMMACLCDFYVELVFFLRVSRWAVVPECIVLIRGILQEAAHTMPAVLEALRGAPDKAVPEDQDLMRTWVAFLLDYPVSLREPFFQA